MSTGTSVLHVPSIGPIHENHQLRQFFFAEDTIRQLAELLEQFENPCCLCAPMVAWKLAEQGRWVRALDLDTRFRFLPGFREYNLYRPDYLQEEFDLILCDPPFHAVGLGQLFKAINTVSHFNPNQKILMSHLVRRQWGVVGVFSKFGLQPTSFHPRYLTAKKCNTDGKSRVVFYANFEVGGDEESNEQSAGNRIS